MSEGGNRIQQRAHGRPQVLPLGLNGMLEEVSCGEGCHSFLRLEAHAVWKEMLRSWDTS